MRIPKPPWYDYLNKRLEGSDWLVNAILITIIIVSVVMMIRNDRVAKTSWAVYLMSP